MARFHDYGSSTRRIRFIANVCYAGQDYGPGSCAARSRCRAPRRLRLRLSRTSDLCTRARRAVHLRTGALKLKRPGPFSQLYCSLRRYHSAEGTDTVTRTNFAGPFLDLTVCR